MGTDKLWNEWINKIVGIKNKSKLVIKKFVLMSLKPRVFNLSF